MNEVSKKSSVEDHCAKCGFYMEAGTCKTCLGSDQEIIAAQQPHTRPWMMGMLHAAGFHIERKNSDHHWIITKQLRFDYWPSTDKFRIMNKGKTMHGFAAMMKSIKEIGF